jgi:hypothetical protein
MRNDPVSSTNDTPEPLNRNLGQDYERIARLVNARHTAGEAVRRYRRPPTLQDRMEALERRCERLEATIYELVRVAA